MLNRMSRIPIMGNLLKDLAKVARIFPGSSAYWDKRYAKGGDSGAGSYGKFAEFKAEILNSFVTENNVLTVIEFGCGDGNQLSIASYPEYTGFDVSNAALELCRRRFAGDATKSFKTIDDYNGEKADLALSLDVIFHLVEDDIFEDYMRRLFAAAERFVVIYSSNDENIFSDAPHVQHRKFTSWIEINIPGWKLMRHIPNRHPYQGDYKKGSFSDFFIYSRI